MSAMMVFGAAAFVMPYVYAASSSGGSSTPGASGTAASGTKGGAGGKGDNPGSTSSTTTGGSTTGGSHSTPPPKNPPPKPRTCIPGKCLGDPGYYTTAGHHHCYDGSPGCTCTDPHKCGSGASGRYT
jgi:hypothetical protein